MNATFNQHTAREGHSPNLITDTPSQPLHRDDAAITNKIETLNSPSPLLLPNRIVTHHPKAGLNPIVDAAGYLFSVMGKLKNLKSFRQLNKLQTELIQEINAFQEAIKNHGYTSEYLIVCKYVLCATFDEIISNTPWGNHNQWESYCLLTAFNQDIQHQDKFFAIMERAIKEPSIYIDLMELLYFCLSLGYKGQYRATEHNQYQLEQITNNLYKHIRAYRGSFSKTLSPTLLKAHKYNSKSASSRKTSLTFVFVVTSCFIMTIFVGLGYLMDVISNEAYKNIAQFGKPVLHKTSEQ
ncbi:MAG: type IVB secretion system protein IcmH/DotU [Gammaproteobacteria bacterium]|nr:type IVB secretion system protein IcmH/DotU [Gammaproteobacteria bacterium]MCW5582580.1 type IVB secretion system protein IcmH/DotU [Gammaproteobacteria bacterium]